MNESENENLAPDNVLHGPWKTKKVKIPENDIYETRQEMAFVEELSEKVVIQLAYTLAKNGVDTDTKEFFQNIAFLVESLKSALYKERGWDHPLTTIIEKISEVSEENSDTHETITLKLNIRKIDALIKKINLVTDDNSDQAS